MCGVSGGVVLFFMQLNLMAGQLVEYSILLACGAHVFIGYILKGPALPYYIRTPVRHLHHYRCLLRMQR